MPDIALVTCRSLPEQDPDEELLLNACANVGLSVELAAWDNPEIDWGRFRIAKLHSCWNYYEDPCGFGKWIDRASTETQIWNPPKMVRQNLDKRYLGKLEAHGVPVVPTRYLSCDSDLREALDDTGWEQFVIKPTVSAASYMTKRFYRDEVCAAEAFAGEILKSREAMVQPYMASVETGGEVSLIHIDGELTHCIAKEPRFSGHDESVSVAFQPSEALAAAAEVVMNTVKGPWLYSRVDLMLSVSGEWILSELELIEPSLFLLQHPPAVERLVAALKFTLERM